jgi:hypothetical protein
MKHTLSLPEHLTTSFSCWNELVDYFTCSSAVLELKKGIRTPAIVPLRKLPDIPATKSNLIIPEDVDVNQHSATHIWAGCVSDCYLSGVTFVLIPKYSIIDLPGRCDWGYVREQDIVASCRICYGELFQADTK